MMVATAAGEQDRVAGALRARGVRVARRSARGLQVVVRDRRQRGTILATPGVVRLAAAPAAFGDATTGEGPIATGAQALADVANGGAGVRIAVIDMGFGTQLAAGQARGDLPPARRLSLHSFDAAGGLAGANAYGGTTDHGDVVAQAVYDFAPRATYLFVNYHTVDDFIAATDWIATQHVDIVVHANNFLDGPFDGTSPAARAVDRAAAAGTLWVNSAGNYGQKAWHGAWHDVDGDGYHDWSAPWTITRTGDAAITFHSGWTNPVGAQVSDIDMVIERLQADGSWAVVARGGERQRDGAAPLERVSGFRPGAGTYRMRLQLVAGPPPGGELTLYSREDNIPAALLGQSWSPRSTPTPADAAGAIAVAAVDWRSGNLMPYSSRGPTLDGRRKPDLTGPTGTRVFRRGGELPTGGTSISAPNVAGAAAVLLSSARAAGQRPGAAELRALLERDAADLGPPGPDTDFGVGRVRLDTQAPVLHSLVRVPREPTRGVVTLRVHGGDETGLLNWRLFIDGQNVARAPQTGEVVTSLVRTNRFPDGRHEVWLRVSDPIGNASTRSWTMVFDNTAPRLAASVVVAGPTDAPKRRLEVTLQASDAVALRVPAVIRVTTPTGRAVARRRAVLVGGQATTLTTRALPAGRYRVDVVARDDAGNERTRRVRVRVAAVSE